MTKQILSTEVAIIGGGVIGASIAYFISQTGVKSLLIERGQIGKEGSTSVSKGILRVFDPILELAQISTIGMDYYLNWEKNQAPGASPTHHSGMLYRLKPENVANAQQVIDAVHSEAYPIYLNQTPDSTLKQSGVDWQTADAMIYEPKGGYGNPTLTAQRFLQGAQKNGTQVFDNTTVLSIHPVLNHSEHRWELSTPEQSIRCNQVIVAGGAYCMDLLVNLACYTRSISIPEFKIDSTDFRATSVSLIDEVENTFIRPLDDSRFIAGSQLFEMTHWSNLTKTVNHRQVYDAQTRAQKTLHDSIQLSSHGGETGFDAYTQDLMPLMGELEQSQGIYLASGFSGRGYKMAPAVGMGVSEWLCQIYGLDYPFPTRVDLQSFVPERFSNHLVTPIPLMA